VGGPFSPSPSLIPPRDSETPKGPPAHSTLGWNEDEFPTSMLHCHAVIRWPLGVVPFRGSVKWHVAHRACLAKIRAHPYSHLASRLKRRLI